ncbi:mavicyanin [Coffea arabica]|uniref:Mavicyanin n=1 Tax=Coffea arabica TaxID=13443 RepID=A0A6P6UFG4_COFAR|nr:mavicyanin-like [Coffea arabica]
MAQMMSAGGSNSKGLMTLLLLFLLFLGIGGKRVAAQVHHVVGDDNGWTPSTDLGSWLTGRVFRVGDKIWFAYPATEERILELQTSEEFFTCDLSNPIRMYTSGLDKIPLESEGVRFFTSGSLDSCKNGLKLPVKVHPQVKNETLADGPTSPAAAPHFPGLSVALFVGLALFCMGM